MKQKDFVIILIPLFILTILWVIFSIYHNYATSTIKSPLTVQILPIEGSFNNNAIIKIRNRRRINPLYEAQVQSVSELTPTPASSTNIPTDEKISSNSAEIDLTFLESEEAGL